MALNNNSQNGSAAMYMWEWFDSRLSGEITPDEFLAHLDIFEASEARPFHQILQDIVDNHGKHPRGKDGEDHPKTKAFRAAVGEFVKHPKLQAGFRKGAAHLAQTFGKGEVAPHEAATAHVFGIDQDGDPRTDGAGLERFVKGAHDILKKHGTAVGPHHAEPQIVNNLKHRAKDQMRGVEAKKRGGGRVLATGRGGSGGEEDAPFEQGRNPNAGAKFGDHDVRAAVKNATRVTRQAHKKKRDDHFKATGEKLKTNPKHVERDTLAHVTKVLRQAGVIHQDDEFSLRDMERVQKTGKFGYGAGAVNKGGSGKYTVKDDTPSGRAEKGERAKRKTAWRERLGMEPESAQSARRDANREAIKSGGTPKAVTQQDLPEPSILKHTKPGYKGDVRRQPGESRAAQAERLAGQGDVGPKKRILPKIKGDFKTSKGASVKTEPDEIYNRRVDTEHSRSPEYRANVAKARKAIAAKIRAGGLEKAPVGSIEALSGKKVPGKVLKGQRTLQKQILQKLALKQASGSFPDRMSARVARDGEDDDEAASRLEKEVEDAPKRKAISKAQLSKDLGVSGTAVASAMSGLRKALRKKGKGLGVNVPLPKFYGGQKTARPDGISRRPKLPPEPEERSDDRNKRLQHTVKSGIGRLRGDADLEKAGRALERAKARGRKPKYDKADYNLEKMKRYPQGKKRIPPEMKALLKHRKENAKPTEPRGTGLVNITDGKKSKVVRDAAPRVAKKFDKRGAWTGKYERTERQPRFDSARAGEPGVGPDRLLGGKKRNIVTDPKVVNKAEPGEFKDAGEALSREDGVKDSIKRMIGSAKSRKDSKNRGGVPKLSDLDAQERKAAERRGRAPKGPIKRGDGPPGHLFMSLLDRITSNRLQESNRRSLWDRVTS